MFEQHYRPSSEASTTTHPTAQPPQLSSMMAEFGYDDDNVVDLDVSLDPFEEYREMGVSHERGSNRTAPRLNTGLTKRRRSLHGAD